MRKDYQLQAELPIPVGPGRIADPTPQQIEVFDFVREGTGHGIIEARAGSGKTSTLVESLYHIPAGHKAVFLAFNRAISDDLKKKTSHFREGQFEVMTLSAFGLRAWKNFTGKFKIGVDVKKAAEEGFIQILKIKYMASEEPGDEHKNIILAHSISKLMWLVSGAKNEGLVPDGIPGTTTLVPDTMAEWKRIIKKYGLTEDLDGVEDAAVVLAKMVLTEGLKPENLSKTITYDDMFYAPIAYGIPFTKFEFVFVDEAQDVNAIQLEAIRRLAAAGSRIIAVGDTFQAIYGFRGAASRSMAQILQGLDAKQMTLSVSFRCPIAVIEKANELVPDIEAKAGAGTGEVKDIGILRTESLKPGDTVLCRYNAPLASLAKNLMRLKMPFRINGKNFGDGLKKIILERKAKDPQELMEKLDAWISKKAEKATDKAKEKALEELVDKIEFIEEVLAEGDILTIDDLIQCIDNIFNRPGLTGGKEVLLSTIHGAKGLEWDTVIYLDAIEPLICNREGLPQSIEEELNIAYVAITRSKKNLYFATKQYQGKKAGHANHKSYVCSMLAKVQELQSSGGMPDDISELFSKNWKKKEEEEEGR